MGALHSVWCRAGHVPVDSSTLDSTGVRAMGRRCLASDITCGIFGMGSISACIHDGGT